MSWCAYDACMHTWYKKYGMICHAHKCLINHALLSKRAQKFEDMERKKHTSNLIQFFLFFNFFQHFHFQVESHYIDPPLFRQTFFVKKLFFFIIFNMAFFNNISFQTYQFFLPIFNHLKIFFLFKIKYHPTSRKKQNEKLFIFFVFFLEIENIFFLFWQESNFVNLNKTIKFINTKTRSFFFIFLTKKTTHVYLLYY